MSAIFNKTPRRDCGPETIRVGKAFGEIQVKIVEPNASYEVKTRAGWITVAAPGPMNAVNRAMEHIKLY